jgi:hypothetical protein
MGIVAGLSLGLQSFAKPPVEYSKPIIFQGMCDASAAAAIDDEHFIAASDEENILRIFSNHAGGPALKQQDLSRFLELDPAKPETDIEGAARIGNRIYWISSHSRNRHGRVRPDRHRFFATDVNATNLTITPVGKPYTYLLNDLIKDPQLKQYKLDEASRLPPKAKDALNIEALAATPEGHLLIGFRNPIPKGKALIVPMLNPEEVIKGGHARFGAALELDLGGDGVRDMALRDDKYVIIAGSAQGGGASRLYRWKIGKDDAKEVKGGKMKGANPEALVFYPGDADFQVFCDSGRSKGGEPECKDQPEARRAFESFWVLGSKEP